MIEYYREALLEAVVYCTVNGYDEEYVVNLDVYAFGEVYKYLRRIDARKQITNVNDVRAATNASKKEYGKYLAMKEVWLPKQEMSGVKHNSNDGKAFQKRVDNGF